MFSLRCFKCGWPINLKRAEIEAAVTEAMATNDSHYALTCPQCRRLNKVSVKEMRRKLPRGWKPAEAAEAAETPEAPEAPETSEES